VRRGEQSGVDHALVAFAFAIGACLLAALASWWRGRRYVEGETSSHRLERFLT
jgi:hypothetical protein